MVIMVAVYCPAQFKGFFSACDVRQQLTLKVALGPGYKAMEASSSQGQSWICMGYCTTYTVVVNGNQEMFHFRHCICGCWNGGME